MRVLYLNIAYRNEVVVKQILHVYSDFSVPSQTLGAMV